MQNDHTYHKGNLREKLINEAAKIISREGIKNLSMRKLSQKLNISRTAAYHHFKNKEELLRSVAETGFKRLRSQFFSVINNSDQPDMEVLKKMILIYVQFAVQETDFFRLMFTNVVDRPFRFSGSIPDIQDFLFSSQEAFFLFDDFIKFVSSCQVKGLFKESDPLIAANTIWAFFHGVALLIIDNQIKVSSQLNDFLDKSFSLFANGLLKD
jgi:AcrR family transcriptional regulator